MKHIATIVSIVLLSLETLACQGFHPNEPVELAHDPLDSTQNLVNPAAVRFVSADSSDGNGSLAIEAKLPLTVELLAFTPEQAVKEKDRLIYQAKMKANGLQGTAYLEMWCDFGPKGEYVSRGQDDAVGGDSEWKTVQTHYTVPAGKKLERVRLNLVINGQGMVWIDDLRLFKSE